jgi:transcriptional regulator with XRE-family HTH domain
MKPKDFKRWRKSLGLSQKAAAESLGLKRRVVQYYEKGVRDGKDVEIPKSVRLACFALTEGVSDYHGPREAPERSEPALRLVTGVNGAELIGDEAVAAADAALRPNGAAKKSKNGKDKREKDKDREKKKRDKNREKDHPIAAKTKSGAAKAPNGKAVPDEH